MKKIVLIIACGFGLSAASQAQVMFAPAAGLSLSNAFYKAGSDDKENTKIEPGFHVGGLVAIPITNNISFMPGVFFNQKGFKYYNDNVPLIGKVDENFHLSTIEVPVNIAYMSGEPGTGRFMAHIGPYVGYNVSGKIKYENQNVLLQNRDLEIGDDKTKDDIKPLEIGANAGVGYMLPMGLFGRFDYHHGLNNLIPGGDSKNSYKNQTFMITFGYFFGG